MTNNYLGNCTCNNKLNVHAGVFTATGKQIVYMFTCKACKERKYRLERNNNNVRPETKKEQYYRALRSELNYFEEENGNKPTESDKLEIMYYLRNEGYGMYQRRA
jgi:hypothetical protein